MILKSTPVFADVGFILLVHHVSHAAWANTQTRTHRHASAADLIPLYAPTSDSNPARAGTGSEHVRTPGLLQAFPLREGSDFFRQQQDDGDDEGDEDEAGASRCEHGARMRVQMSTALQGVQSRGLGR